MIDTVTMYRVLCDGCGTSASEDADYYAWANEDGARNDAECAEFQTIDGKDYCPGCWEWDEETDAPKAKTAGQDHD